MNIPIRNDVTQEEWQRLVTSVYYALRMLDDYSEMSFWTTDDHATRDHLWRDFDAVTRDDKSEPQELFPTITCVSRADLEHVGYDASNVDDATMSTLAVKMKDAYLDSNYWIDLPIIADALDIPKIKHCVIADCERPLTFKNDQGEYFCEKHALEAQDAIDCKVFEVLKQEMGNPDLEWDGEQIGDRRDELDYDVEYPYVIEREAQNEC